ncbi:hypothetical protein OS493_019813 [Desmophyllum pertusum]|uniref:Uncharacterized protein n=1 Tax=Desmophyllum pertusum TaxID=174260 RepID=A0A9W9YZR0_9CNID|nr:hypothetical protein OS493_019813 [Desmophyllum pertusum]
MHEGDQTSTTTCTPASGQMSSRLITSTEGQTGSRSDNNKWMDPNVGPWEMVKLFLPDVGFHMVILSVEDMEITAILNLMFWCNHFTVQRPLIKDVRDTRNTKWAHLPKFRVIRSRKERCL